MVASQNNGGIEWDPFFGPPVRLGEGGCGWKNDPDIRPRVVNSPRLNDEQRYLISSPPGPLAQLPVVYAPHGAANTHPSQQSAKHSDVTLKDLVAVKPEGSEEMDPILQ